MIEDLLQNLVDRLDHRYYGKHRGFVHRVDDPLKLGRIQAKVPRLLGDAPTGWCMPCAPYAGPDQGFFTVPELGSGVWIEFEAGDLSRPIWTGSWWGRPEDGDLGQPDSGANPRPPRRTVPETPQHDHPPETAEPGVRILKSASGHHIVLDDRPEKERVEIHDRFGNRMIFTKEGAEHIVSNDRTVNRGNRSATIDQDDSLTVKGDQIEEVQGQYSRVMFRDASTQIQGDLTESAGGGAYSRQFNHEGLDENIAYGHTARVRGAFDRRVDGAISDSAGSGYGISAGGPINLLAGGPVNISGTVPDLPSLNTISIDALGGNISVNTKIGIMQIGGLSAVSPLVVGDGLAIHLTALVQILKTINPVTVSGYGPALDAWLALLPMTDLSYFAFVKRVPFG